VLERVRASSVDDVLVVIGAYQVQTEAQTVKCAEWELGPGASLRCGLEALPDETEAAVVVLADGPRISPAAIDRVIAAWRATDEPVVVASYDGDRGHPLLVERSRWPNVPEEGLRNVRGLLVPCDDLGSPGDVDRPADLG
jgi:CTP:molybdopterin cytidylyltransferase MocA